MRQELVDVNGQRLYVTDTEGAGPVLLFAHGNLMDASMWSAVAGALAPQCRCLSWDMRLHGRSEDDGRPYTYWDAARDGLAVLDWAKVPEAFFVGHSQGGFTALRAALLAHDRIAGLVLCDTMAHTFNGEALLQMASIRDGFAAGAVDATATAVLGLLLGDADCETAWKDKLLRQPPARLARAVGVLMSVDDVAEALGTITAPTLVIHGDQDQPIPIELGRELANALPAADWLPIPGAAHTPPLTEGAAVAAAIASFVDGARHRTP
jgi:3-oxoadipate enol-lactonase